MGTMIELGLGDALKTLDASAPGQFKADGWLRSLLMGHVATMISNMGVDQVDQARVQLAKDMEATKILIDSVSVEGSLSSVAVSARADPSHT